MLWVLDMWDDWHDSIHNLNYFIYATHAGVKAESKQRSIIYIIFKSAFLIIFGIQNPEKK